MSETIVIAFYKPYGVLTAFTDPEGRETLKTYIDLPGVYPAGRLDLDSEGLLLLTNDGSLAHRLTDPRFNHPKTYLVQVEGEPTPEALARLASGVEVKSVRTRRAQVMVTPEPDLPPRAKPVTPHGPTTWLRIVLREGMKRQIRHMTAAVGLPTLRLVRVASGPIGLSDLQPGQWRYLSPAEIGLLRKQLAEARPAVNTRRRSLGNKGKVPRRPTENSSSSPDDSPPAKAGGKPGAYPGNTRGSRYRSGDRRSRGR